MVKQSNKNIKHRSSRIILDRRGQVQYFLESAFRIGFLMVALLVFFLLVNFFIGNRIDVNRLESEVVANRIMYSDAIMYKEDSVIHYGILDLDKFNDDTLSKKIDYSMKRHAAVKMVLISNNDGKEYKVAYLNKDSYDKLEVLIASSAQGKGSATKYTKNFPVSYKDGVKYKYGTIIMEIIIPNS